MPPILSELCDALELIAVQRQQIITVDDFAVELQTEDRMRVEEVFSYALARKISCTDSYPFDVSKHRISLGPVGFDPYLFLLLGSSLFLTTDSRADAIKRDFRKYFEDFVSYAAGKYLGGAVVFSEPRGDRGLPVSIVAALRKVASISDEPARLCAPKILQRRLSPHDNDLGADIVAWLPSLDSRRTCRPIFFIQCATTRSDAELDRKLSEKRRLFCDAWEEGFFAECATCALATPRDLVDTDPFRWRRLSRQGWVLDRIRILNLLKMGMHSKLLPEKVMSLLPSLIAIVPLLDYRHGWSNE